MNANYEDWMKSRVGLEIRLDPTNTAVREKIGECVAGLVKHPHDILGSKLPAAELGEGMIKLALGELPVEGFLTNVPLAPPKYRFSISLQTEPHQMWKSVLIARTVGFQHYNGSISCSMNCGWPGASVQVHFEFAARDTEGIAEWRELCGRLGLDPDDPQPTETCSLIQFKGDLRLYLTPEDRAAIERRKRGG